MLVQGRHGAPAPAVLLRVVEDVDRLLSQVPGTLGGGEDEGRAGVDRPVAVVDDQRLFDHAPVQVVLDRELVGFVQGVEPPGRLQAFLRRLTQRGASPSCACRTSGSTGGIPPGC